MRTTTTRLLDGSSGSERVKGKGGFFSSLDLVGAKKHNGR